MDAWLYPISERAENYFLIRGGKRFDVNIENFVKLVRDRHLTNEERTWYVSKNFNNVNVGDEVFIYTGDEDRGIIGYATIQFVDRENRDITLLFDREKCLQLLGNSIPASEVRKWVLPRFSVVKLTPHLKKLNSRLPWPVSHQKELPNSIAEANECGGAGFGGDYEQNKKVEKAAVRAVTKAYKEKGWNVESMELEGCGYDLLCSKGSQTKKVEVKGVAGTLVSFIITRGERIAASKYEDFVLNVVCNALSRKRIIKTWNGQQIEANFKFNPLQYLATLKNA